MRSPAAFSTPDVIAFVKTCIRCTSRWSRAGFSAHTRPQSSVSCLLHSEFLSLAPVRGYKYCFEWEMLKAMGHNDASHDCTHLERGLYRRFAWSNLAKRKWATPSPVVCRVTQDKLPTRKLLQKPQVHHRYHLHLRHPSVPFLPQSHLHLFQYLPHQLMNTFVEVSRTSLQWWTTGAQFRTRCWLFKLDVTTRDKDPSKC